MVRQRSSRSGRRRRTLDADRWQKRRAAAFFVRIVVLFAPVVVSVAAAFVVTRLVTAPAETGRRLLWLAGVVFVCGLLAWPTRRLLRRLLPLAALLELSLLFPGEAPARWKVAREAGSIKHLEMLATGVPDAEPVRAATTILALVASLARHDQITRGHSERVRVFTDMISEELGLPRADRDRLRWAALIHDVGKLDVPARLLRKPGKPTASEWLSLRTHPEVGARLTAPIADWLGEHALVVRQHHERFDGSGYPDGLRGDEISMGARIVGLADAFEVMTAARPYKRAFSRAAALREVVRCSGTHFDPDVVRAFLAVSTPRLRRALGPVSWIGQLPVVGTAPVGGLPAVATTVARGAGTVVVGGMATAVVAGSVAPPSVPSASPTGHHSVVQISDPAAASLTRTPHLTGYPTAPATASPPSSGVDGGQDVAAQSPLAAGDASGGASGSAGGNGTVDASTSELPGVATPSPQLQAAIGNTVNSVTNSVAGTVDGVTDGVTGAVDGVTDVVDGVTGGATGGLTGVVDGAVNGVTGGVSGVVDGVTGGVTGTVDGVAGTVNGLLGGSSNSNDGDAQPSPTPSATPTDGGGLLGTLLGQ